MSKQIYWTSNEEYARATLRSACLFLNAILIISSSTGDNANVVRKEHNRNDFVVRSSFPWGIQAQVGSAEELSLTSSYLTPPGRRPDESQVYNLFDDVAITISFPIVAQSLKQRHTDTFAPKRGRPCSMTSILACFRDSLYERPWTIDHLKGF